MTDSQLHEPLSLVKRSREIRSLTGIRGIAAWFVVFYHLFQGTPSFAKLTYTFRGYLAVDLFFVLSGFVMALTYGSNVVANGFGRRMWVDFIYKRLARIYPVYFVILMILVVMAAGGLFRPVKPGDVASNLLLIQAWGFSTGSIIGPSWSISTEFAAYFAFPFIAYVVLKGSTAILALTFLMSAGCVFLAAGVTDAQLLDAMRHGPLDVYTPGTPYPLIRCIGGFSLGVIAYKVAAFGWCKRVIGFPYAADVLLLIILFVLRFPRLDAPLVLLFVPFVISLSYERSVTSRLLGWGFIYYSGMISYSLYLIHAPLNEIFRLPLETILTNLHVVKVRGIAGIILLLPLSVLAAACFHGIEKPARDAARLLKMRRAFT